MSLFSLESRLPKVSGFFIASFSVVFIAFAASGNWAVLVCRL